MTKYIAFLRGINVGNIRIKMTDLKAAFENMGCQEVKTYLQTGNVVFNSNKKANELIPLLQQGLSTNFNYDAYVLLYEYSILSSVMSVYPFERDEAHHAYVLFVENNTTLNEIANACEGLDANIDLVKIGDGVVYWKVKVGNTLDTPFSKLLAKPKYKSCTTMRNLNTLEKMV
ncbi:MAG: DUF1697 domain-containing protein [Saprospiraceae bacterium]|nr:DUF1697 domain-containing protein [Saprospiraceae bacterium]